MQSGWPLRPAKNLWQQKVAHNFIMAYGNNLMNYLSLKLGRASNEYLAGSLGQLKISDG